MEPLNAIAAATHPDPYPYYRRLLAGSALVFDEGLGLWIASRAAVVAEVMANPHCQVRPVAEAVPDALAGSSAGAVFARLARMNDGAPHAQAKHAIGIALGSVDMALAGRRSVQLARTLTFPDGAAVTRWLFDLPTFVVAHLLGFDETELPQVAQWTADFVRCLSPLSTPGQLASASIAALALRERIAQLLETGRPDSLARRAAQLGWADTDALIANLVGLLSQTHEATAGLIGNCIVALLAQPAMQARLRADASLAGAFVHEVARADPPVQNTRRFVAQATSVAGVRLQPGNTVLLLLAAASHDPGAGQAMPGFGHGRHACPGQALAFTIATGAVQHLLSLPHPLDPQALGWTYAPSVNARLPLFFNVSAKGQS
ncbi:MAG: cytochrome P450 [Telluria sp.]